MMLRTLPALALLAACGPDGSGVPDAGIGIDGPTGDCVGAETRCVGTLYQRCQDDAWTDVEQCTSNQVCSRTIGCVECDPNQDSYCVGDEVYGCTDDGSRGDHLSTCALESCVDGACNDACGEAASAHSYLGCEYWPVDLDNNIDLHGEPIPGNGCSIYASTITGVTWTTAAFSVCVPGAGQAGNGGLCDYGGDCSLAGGGTCQPMTLCAVDAGHSPFAVVVSNPDDDDPVDVTLHGPAGESYTETVAAGAVAVLEPQELGFPDRSLDGSEVGAKAYRLTSTHPIVAYQFNPLDHDAGVFSNDASLLLPTHTHDLEYFAVSWPTQTRRPYRHDSNSFVTVVASSPGTTSVIVTPTAAIRAGLGVDASAAGIARLWSLQRGEVLNLEAVASGDLTGTRVVANKPVGVFSGHEATTVGETAPAPCCMDHLEEQLFPASAWGMRYAVVQFISRGPGVRDIVRIMAQKPNTSISFSPPVASCPVLGAGQWCQVAIDAAVDISATQPIQVAHYMTSIGGTTENSADPDLAIAVPVEQYRRDYTVLVPEEYFHNYFALITQTGSSITVDGMPVTTAPFGSAGLSFAILEVASGQHRIGCPDGCGVEIYGWADAVSYAYPGGLDLVPIVIP